MKGISNLIHVEKIESIQRSAYFSQIGINQGPKRSLPENNLRKQARFSDTSMRKFFVNGIGKEVQCGKKMAL